MSFKKAIPVAMVGSAVALAGGLKVLNLRRKLEVAHQQTARIEADHRKVESALYNVANDLRDLHRSAYDNALEVNRLLERHPGADFLSGQVQAHATLQRSDHALATAATAFEDAYGHHHPVAKEFRDRIRSSWELGSRMTKSAQRVHIDLAPGRRGRGHR